jgi:hypothetical protein
MSIEWIQRQMQRSSSTNINASRERKVYSPRDNNNAGNVFNDYSVDSQRVEQSQRRSLSIGSVNVSDIENSVSDNSNVSNEQNVSKTPKRGFLSRLSRLFGGGNSQRNNPQQSAPVQTVSSAGVGNNTQYSLDYLDDIIARVNIANGNIGRKSNNRSSRANSASIKAVKAIKNKYQNRIKSILSSYGINDSVEHEKWVNLISSIILQESGGSPTAKSPTGVVGLMQVTFDTGRAVINRFKSLMAIAGKKINLSSNDIKYNSNKDRSNENLSLLIGVTLLLKDLGINVKDRKSIENGLKMYNAGDIDLERILRNQGKAKYNEVNNYVVKIMSTYEAIS